jgi:hypothetical protein
VSRVPTRWGHWIFFFSVYLILPVALRPWGWLSRWQKWIPGIFLGGKALPLRKTDNLIVTDCRRICGILDVSQPYRHPCPCTGIALLLILNFYTLNITPLIYRYQRFRGTRCSHLQGSWEEMAQSSLAILKCILHFLLYGIKTSPQALKEECRLMMFQDRILRVYGPEVQEVTAKWW